MRLFVLLAVLMVSISSFADEMSVRDFLAVTQGNWNGQGRVEVQLPRPQKYSITVGLTVSQSDENTWAYWSEIKGTPGSGNTTTTTYQVVKGSLNVISTQYSAPAQIQISTSSELAFKTTHEDPVNHNTVSTVKDMKFLANGNLQILSDIYQNGKLIQHFDYELQKGQD